MKSTPLLFVLLVPSFLQATPPECLTRTRTYLSADVASSVCAAMEVKDCSSIGGPKVYRTLCSLALKLSPEEKFDGCAKFTSLSPDELGLCERINFSNNQKHAYAGHCGTTVLTAAEDDFETLAANPCKMSFLAGIVVALHSRGDHATCKADSSDLISMERLLKQMREIGGVLPEEYLSSLVEAVLNAIPKPFDLTQSTHIEEWLEKAIKDAILRCTNHEDKTDLVADLGSPPSQPQHGFSARPPIGPATLHCSLSHAYLDLNISKGKGASKTATLGLDLTRLVSGLTPDPESILLIALKPNKPEPKMIEALQHENTFLRILATRYPGRWSPSIQVSHSLQFTHYFNRGTLADFIQTGRLTDSQKLNIARQVIEQMRLLHDAGILHRDLKPENIFVEEHGRNLQVSIRDFDMAQTEDELKSLGYAAARKFGGTPAYASYWAQMDFDGVSDERLAFEKKQADTYSTACTLYDLIQNTYRAPTQVLAGCQEITGHPFDFCIQCGFFCTKTDPPKLAELKPGSADEMIFALMRSQVQPADASSSLGQLSQGGSSKPETSLGPPSSDGTPLFHRRRPSPSLSSSPSPLRRSHSVVPRGP